MAIVTPGPTYDHLESHSTITCWKSVIGGVFVCLLIFLLEICAGLAFGGIGLSGGTTGESALRFTGSWITISALIATFVGSVHAVRASRKINIQSGISNALLVVSIFTVLFVMASGSIVSGLASVAGGSLQAIASSAKDGASALAQNSYAQGKAYDALGELKLKHDPEVVGKNVAARLLDKDVDGAKNYLAGEAGISPQEADQKIQDIENKLNEAAVKVREGTAQAMKETGSSLFFFILLSTLFAILGGYLAAKKNESHVRKV